LVVVRLLLPTNENATEAIHPGVESLDDPTPGTTAMNTLRNLFVAARFDVRRVVPSAGFTTNHVRVESLVATKMLPTTGCRTGTTKRNAFESCVEEFLVVAVRAVNCQTQGYTAAIGQHRSFDARLAPICRVWAGFFPRPREPWWSPRRDFATSIGCRAARRNAATDTSRACGTPGVASTLGSSGARNCRSRTREEPLSIGNRFAKRRRCRRRPSEDQAVAARPAARCDTWARTTPCVPTTHREYANSDTSVRCPYENPP
jgi:hypothetical protein